jgi:hypothetical protein
VIALRTKFMRVFLVIRRRKCSEIPCQRFSIRGNGLPVTGSVTVMALRVKFTTCPPPQFHFEIPRLFQMARER